MSLFAFPKILLKAICIAEDALLLKAICIAEDAVHFTNVTLGDLSC